MNKAIDIPISLPSDDTLQLDEYLGHGLQAGEAELPDDKSGTLHCYPGAADVVYLRRTIPFLSVPWTTGVQCGGNGSARRHGLSHNSMPQGPFSHREQRPERCDGMAFPTYGRSWFVLRAIFLCKWLIPRFSDIDAPFQLSGTSAGPEPLPEQINMLADMGFTHAQAAKALRETVSSLAYDDQHSTRLTPF